MAQEKHKDTWYSYFFEIQIQGHQTFKPYLTTK